MSGEAEVAAAASKWWHPNMGIIKNLPLIGLLGAAAVTVPFIVSDIRKSRRIDEDNLPLPKSMSDPLPPVLQYTPPPQPLQQPVQYAAPSMGLPDTMMGERPRIGAFAQRELNRRAGINAGPDVTPPNVMAPSGVSMIDGKHVQDLQKEALMPGKGPTIQ